MIIPTYENALLWHERDLANSSSEGLLCRTALHFVKMSYQKHEMF